MYAKLWQLLGVLRNIWEREKKKAVPAFHLHTLSRNARQTLLSSDAPKAPKHTKKKGFRKACDKLNGNRRYLTERDTYQTKGLFGLSDRSWGNSEMNEKPLAVEKSLHAKNIHFRKNKKQSAFVAER